MNSSLLGSGETLCSAFYIHPPTLIFAETRCRRGGGGGGGFGGPSTKRKRVLGAVAWLAPAPPRPQAARSLARLFEPPATPPWASSPAWRIKATRAQRYRISGPPSPTAGTPGHAGPRPTSAWRPARAVRKEEPARRPRKGCAYLAGRGLRPQLASPRPTAPHPAPLAPTADTPAVGHRHFHFPQHSRQESESESGREAGLSPSAR